MPYVVCKVPVKLSEEDVLYMKKRIAEILYEVVGKSERYVMIDFSDDEKMFFGGELGNCAFSDVRLLGGLSGDQKDKIVEHICKLFSEIANVPAERVFINITEFEGENWGWNSKTFR